MKASLVFMVVAVLIAACSSTPIAEPDRVATRVAEDLAVARTLTAVAQAAVPTEEIAQVEPTATLQRPTPLPTETPLLPTEPLQPTETPFVPTATPRPTDIPIPEDPTVPGFGDPNGLVGQIVLPGYTGSPELPEFSDSIVFRLMVHDPDFGTEDGAGIVAVEISIDDPLGRTVHTRREMTAGYCGFGGGEPACDVWRFAEHNNQWPSGEPVCAGQGYQANMIVRTQDSHKDEASWRFNFNITGPYSPC